jgi:nicotinamide-nucleotide amidase
MGARVKAEILTIGDEILRGEIVDSNKARISERLLTLDIECHQQVSVRDDPEDMRDAFLRAVGRSDFVLVSGGLGPTRDDLTTEVLADTFGLSLELDAPSLEAIETFFRNIEREMSEPNRKQALFPKGAEVLANPVGTAPGFMLEVARGAGAAAPNGTALIFSMPGVPRELALMLDEQVLPRIGTRLTTDRGGEVTLVRTRLLRTFGIGESSLEAELADIARDGEVDVNLGFRTTFPDNYLRVVARGHSPAEADARIAQVVKEIEQKLGALVYSKEEEDESLAMVVGRLLSEQGKTVATAESCTGGMIGELITDVPGSSAWFLGGIAAYANSAKTALLGVPEAVLAEHGAVSDPVACAMAQGARERFGADIAVATTGISGPGGGTPEKPVGLVHVALAQASGVHVDHFVFPLDRARHRRLTAQVGLDWIRRALLGLELVGPSLLRRMGGGSAPGGRRS